MRRGIFFIAFVAAVASAAVSVGFWNELQAARAEAATLASAATSPKRVVSPLPKVDPPIELPLQVEKPEPPPPKATPAATTRPLMPCSEWQRLLTQAQQNDPKWHDAVLALNKVDSEENWPTMASDLGLSDEQADALYDLLGERQMRDSYAGMKPSSTPDEAREFQRLHDQSLHESDLAIGALLGPEKYEQFRDYRASSYARTQVDRLQTALGSSGNGLQAEQIRALTRSLYKGQQTVVYRADAQPANVPARQSPHDVAAQILSPEQLARFDELLRADSARSEAVNRMYGVQREWAQRDKPAD